MVSGLNKPTSRKDAAGCRDQEQILDLNAGSSTDELCDLGQFICLVWTQLVVGWSKIMQVINLVQCLEHSNCPYLKRKKLIISHYFCTFILFWVSFPSVNFPHCTLSSISRGSI